jgi:hypothetical protein
MKNNRINLGHLFLYKRKHKPCDFSLLKATHTTAKREKREERERERER